MSTDSDDRVDHRRAWDAIPWLVAGTADPADADFVRAHVQACDDCREELDFQRQLHAGLHLPAHESSRLDERAEAGLRRLRARWAMDDQGVPSRGQPSPALAAVRSQGGFDWTRALVAAVVLQAIGLGLAGHALWGRYEDEYRTYTSAAPTAGVVASIRYVPDPGLSLQALREQLRRAQLRVIDVTADGAAFGLAPVAGATLSRDAALRQLRQEPGVLLAEPVAVVR